MKNLNLIMTTIPSFPQAACATVASPDSWFPEGGSMSPNEQKVVQRICSDCVHQIECLEYSIDNEIEYGTWGGVPAKQRLAMIRAKRDGKRRTGILPKYPKLLEMRKDGLTNRQIADRYQVTIDSVNQALRRGAIKARTPDEAA